MGVKHKTKQSRVLVNDLSVVHPSSPLQPAGNKRLLHPSAEHLICSNEHNADDERNGEGTNQTFAHARVLLLLCWARCGKIYGKTSARRGAINTTWVLQCVGNNNRPHTFNVHVRLWTVQVILLCHDDVLNIFHGEVVAEGVVQQSLQLIHGQFLHVTLGR